MWVLERLQIYSVDYLQYWFLCTITTWGQCCTTIHHCSSFLLRLSSSAVFSSSVVFNRSDAADGSHVYYNESFYSLCAALLFPCASLMRVSYEIIHSVNLHCCSIWLLLACYYFSSLANWRFWLNMNMCCVSRWGHFTVRGVNAVCLWCLVKHCIWRWRVLFVFWWLLCSLGEVI